MNALHEQKTIQMSCTAEEIAAKRAQARELLKRKQASLQHANDDQSEAIEAKSFYGKGTVGITDKLSAFEGKIRTEKPAQRNCRIQSQPYSIPGSSADRTAAQSPSINKQSNPVKNAMPVSCTVQMVSIDRFEVVPSRYHGPLIDIFKKTPTRRYDDKTKIWTFHIKDYETVRKHVNALNPDVTIGTLPKFVLNLLKEAKVEFDYSVLNAIEPKLAASLMDFQRDGVCFGINKQGRCMIADDMGLGKTYQALAIADFYRDNFPLLICTTSNTRGAWAQHVRTLLPSIPEHSITVFQTGKDYFPDSKVVITTNTLMEKHRQRLLDMNFGVVILDESHSLKNFKGKGAAAALTLANKAKRVILLTGTPALSRPSELFTQLQMIDRKFFSFTEYSERYCAAKRTNFGLDASGQSNLRELNVVMKCKFMIRRTKEDVEFELSQKSRETIILDPDKVWNAKCDKMREALENIKVYSADYMKFKGGKQRDEILLKYYSETAHLKSYAVCHYLKALVRDKIKFIVFGHHQHMLNEISECMNQMGTKYIRIDGTTRNECRNEYIDRFQKDASCQVAVLSLKACNAGITLTAAKMVVFAELDWNPSTLAQAESRAHRIGQLEPVTCRYLLAKGTADDVIWQMVQKKQSVLNKAGLFSEDLSDAVHSEAPPPEENLLTQYFKATPATTEKTALHNNNNNEHECKPSTSVSISTPAPISCDKENDLKSLLDDGDDDVLMGLDF